VKSWNVIAEIINYLTGPITKVNLLKNTKCRCISNAEIVGESVGHYLHRSAYKYNICVYYVYPHRVCRSSPAVVGFQLRKYFIFFVIKSRIDGCYLFLFMNWYSKVPRITYLQKGGQHF